MAFGLLDRFLSYLDELLGRKQSIIRLFDAQHDLLADPFRVPLQ